AGGLRDSALVAAHRLDHPVEGRLEDDAVRPLRAELPDEPRRIDHVGEENRHDLVLALRRRGGADELFRQVSRRAHAGQRILGGRKRLAAFAAILTARPDRLAVRAAQSEAARFAVARVFFVLEVALRALDLHGRDDSTTAALSLRPG